MAKIEDKVELAHYLYTLHILMTAIDPSPDWMVKEYHAHWDQLKQLVKEEQNDEARKSELQRARGSEDGAKEHGDESGVRR